jgi:hypothetical protein
MYRIVYTLFCSVIVWHDTGITLETYARVFIFFTGFWIIVPSTCQWRVCLIIEHQTV